jgi:acetylglutamate kinase
MGNTVVIKIGGVTLDSVDTTIEDIVTLQQRGIPLVVVHGGGNTVTDWLKRQGIATEFVRGERVTNLSALEVATAVLTGLVNKEIVAGINCLGGRAVGISGVDGALIESRAKNREMGYVGTVEKVNRRVLDTLLQDGFIPVVAPVSLFSVDRPGDAARIINVNGDPVAGELAAAIKTGRLVFMTDTAGVCDASGALIPRISADEVEGLITSGVISGGMIPKVNACLRALTEGAITRIIDGRVPHALVGEIEEMAGGTTIYK